MFTARLVMRDDDGITEVTRHSDGATFAADPGQQEFCDFLTWQSTQTGMSFLPGLESLEPGEYFCDRARLIAKCKNEGIVLETMEGQAGSGVQLQTIPPSVPIVTCNPAGTTRFHRLNKVSPSGFGTDAEFHETGSVDAGLIVIQDLLRELNRDLKDDTSEIRCLSAWPVFRTFVYIDISDFSKFPARFQNLVVQSLTMLTHNQEHWGGFASGEARRSLEASICIGDGYIFVLPDPYLGACFASHLAHIIEHKLAKREIPEFHFRMGVHVGPVYRFWDWGRKAWNYVGDGINDGRRVLDAIGKQTDDVLFVSAAVRQYLEANCLERLAGTAMLGALLNRGRRKDKHAKPWRVYEMQHSLLRDI